MDVITSEDAALCESSSSSPSSCCRRCNACGTTRCDNTPCVFWFPVVPTFVDNLTNVNVVDNGAIQRTGTPLPAAFVSAGIPSTVLPSYTLQYAFVSVNFATSNTAWFNAAFQFNTTTSPTTAQHGVVATFNLAEVDNPSAWWGMLRAISQTLGNGLVYVAHDGINEPPPVMSPPALAVCAATLSFDNTPASLNAPYRVLRLRLVLTGPIPNATQSYWVVFTNALEPVPITI